MSRKTYKKNIQEDMNQIGKEWLVSRGIIADFLKLLCPNHTREQLEHNAAAIIARLASNDPPILTQFYEEAK